MKQAGPGVDLETSTGYRLKEASQALHDAMEEVLRPLQLTITQYSALEQLAQRPGVSSSDLARGTFVTRQSMSTVLRSLLAAGLITRAATAERGRALPVELTEPGLEHLERASTAVRRVQDRMLADLTSDENAQLLQLLERCARALRP